MKLTKRQQQQKQGRENRGALARSGQDQGQGFWGPLAELARLRNDITGGFASPFDDLLAPASLLGGWTPAFDVYEDKDKFSVKVELPGMKREDIDISLDGNTLTVSGELKDEEEHKDSETYRAERFFGRFQRSITLPQPVDPNRITATYKDGVLKITLPKTEESKRKQIEVKAS
ncbi:MAG: putative HspC2 heat shock protein [Pedosphaera sp.]|nr:putative HspC2 heat shock protein [Pedosphaera sp.]